jgi:hypothetical protein
MLKPTRRHSSQTTAHITIDLLFILQNQWIGIQNRPAEVGVSDCAFHSAGDSAALGIAG